MIISVEDKDEQLQDNLERLNQELDDLSFSYEISDKQRENILTLYRMWKESFNNKIFIENKSGTHIRVKDGKIIDIRQTECMVTEIFTGVNEKSTLYFSNCNDITIVINTKVAHITLEKCKNVNIKVIGGSISGLDNINCTNIIYVFDDGEIYFIDVSNSNGCKFYFSETVALSTIISTTFSYGMKFLLLSDGKVINTFSANDNYFDVSKQFIFQNDNNVVQIKDVSHRIAQYRFSDILPVFAKQLRKFID